MKKLYLALFFLFFSVYVFSQQSSNTIGIKMVQIPNGSFWMGSKGWGEDFDEAPVHRVNINTNFLMSQTEITNAQYEQFDPSHRKLRGKKNFSIENDEAVIFVNYDDAMAFCRWLSEKEGKTYRLPTEAEWEYACRATTLFSYSMDDGLPKVYQKNQRLTWTPEPVDLTVAQTPPNAWGVV